MYTIKDLTMMTGLTDRTLRTYLKTGVLEGTKEKDAWVFSEDQLDAFMKNEVAKAAIQAKKNAIVYDFMANTWKEENAACMVLDLPESNAQQVREFICEAVNKRSGMRMSFEHDKNKTRIILSGREQDVYEIMVEYHNL